MPHFFAKNLRAVAFPVQSENFKFIFEAKSLRDKSAIIFAESTRNGQKILLSKQEKDDKFLVKFNKHFASHSKEIIKSALKEYAQLVGAEIVAHNLNENRVKVDSAYLLTWREICTLLGGNSVLGMQFRTCEKFWESTDSGLVLSQNFSQIQKPYRNHFDCDSQSESTTNQTQNAESALDSANQNNPSLRANPQDLRGNPPCDSALFSSGGLPRSHLLARNDEFIRDSSLRLRSAQNDKIKAENDNLKYFAESSEKFAESTLDSAIFTLSTHEANSSIFDEKSGLCSHEQGNRTDEFIDEASGKLPDLSQKDAGFAMLEIGFGSGRHILHLAQKHPTARIIGLEIYRPAISQVLRQIELLNLQNLYLASIDARVLFEVLPAQCLDRIFLHFPVPWDKNPQRRVLSEQFLSNAMRALKDDGIFELLTDSAEYFAFAKALARDYKCVAEEGVRGEVVSKYEARWRKQNKVIYRLRVANSASCGDFSRLRSPRFLDEPYVLSASLTSHKCENSSTILEFASCVESVDSALDSAESQNLGEKSLSLRDSAKQNRGKPPCNFNNYRLPRSHSLARNDEYLDSSVAPLPQNDNVGLDSAKSQNLIKNNSVRSTKNSPASWCKKSESKGAEVPPADFLLEAEKRGSPPKSEKRQLLARRGSGEGGAALLREETSEISGKRGAESIKESQSGLPREQSSLAMTDFGGLPRRFCESARNDEFLDSSLRLRSAQNDKIRKNAESALDSAILSQGGLPRRFCESARNDEFIRDSSLRLRSAQNDKIEAENGNFGARVAESSLDSAPFSPKKICKKEYFLHIKNKYIFSGGAVVFASFGAYYAPSSAYFVLCGDKVSTISEIIPTRANIDAVGLFMELCFDN